MITLERMSEELRKIEKLSFDAIEVENFEERKRLDAEKEKLIESCYRHRLASKVSGNKSLADCFKQLLSVHCSWDDYRAY